MNGRYCKNERCSEARKGIPCTAYDTCEIFIWDILREKERLGITNDGKDNLCKKGQTKREK